MNGIYLEHRDRPLTLNEIGSSRDHWKRSKEVQKWREVFGYLALSEKRRPKPPIGVVVHHLQRTQQEADLGSPMYAAKGAQDGLVDGRVLTEDGPTIVARLTFLPGRCVGYDGLGLELVEL